LIIDYLLKKNRLYSHVCANKKKIDPITICRQQGIHSSDGVTGSGFLRLGASNVESSEEKWARRNRTSEELRALSSKWDKIAEA
jgi:hypothetical protein